MSCNITYSDGKIRVLDDFGNTSKLYQDAVSKFGEEKGLELYLVSKSNSFLDFFGAKKVEKLNGNGVSPETSTNYANLTEDGQGNFVFYHVGERGYKTIKRGTGQNITTRREEATAIGRVGGLAMYYPAENVAESMIGNNTKYLVKVSKDKVYDFNSDILNMTTEAEELFRKEYPNQAFDKNTQLAFLTKVANSKGFDAVVAKWDGRTRVQTTKELTPIDEKHTNGNTITKDFSAENKFKSNKDKGWVSQDTKLQVDVLKDIYDEISRSVGNDYSNPLYKLSSMRSYTFEDSFAPFKSQEQITKVIEDSAISEDLKNKYFQALSTKDIGGYSYQIIAPEPTLQEVTSYVASNNRTEAELTQNQKADLVNVLMSTPNFKAEDFYDEFGIFRIPAKHYSNYELMTIDEEQVKEAIDSLLNTDFTPNIELNQKVEQVNEKNAFGKLVNINPIIAEKEKIKEEVLNGEREDNKTAEVLIETLEGEVISAKNTNTEQILPLVVKQSFKTDLIDSLQNLSLSTLQQSEEQTRVVLKAIENDLISQGIDAIGLSEKDIDQDLIDYLDTAKTFIKSPTKENTKTFAEKSDIYFERDLEPKIDIVKSNKVDRNYVKLNTDLTEEELYEDKGLIQSELGKGIYIQTAKESLEDLYNNLRTYTEKYPKGQTLEQYVQEQIAEMSYSNAENAEAIVLYKMYFGVDGVNENLWESKNTTFSISDTKETYFSAKNEELFKIKGKLNKFNGDFLINVYNLKGSNIAKLDLKRNTDETYSALEAFVKPEYQNIGIATAMYDFSVLEDIIVKQSDNLLEDGKRFWQRVQNRTQYKSATKQFTGNYNYLTEDFVSDFYIEQLKEKQKNSAKYRNFYSNFEVNEKGINLLNTDDITMQQIEVYADDNLRQYSLVSKQMPDLKVETEINENQRDLIVNNPQTLENYKKDLFRVNDNTIILKDNVDDFVKINDSIYENIESDGNLSVFAQIKTEKSDYYQYNIKQPKSNIKLSDYNYLSTQEELFTSPKKYLKQEEKNKIKEEEFYC